MGIGMGENRDLLDWKMGMRYMFQVGIPGMGMKSLKWE